LLKRKGAPGGNHRKGNPTENLLFQQRKKGSLFRLEKKKYENTTPRKTSISLTAYPLKRVVREDHIEGGEAPTSTWKDQEGDLWGREGKFKEREERKRPRR